MRAKIENLFSQQLKKIEDSNLRKKVVDCWVSAAKKGGWKPDELEEIPFTLLTDTKGINLIQHTIAVTEGALGIALGMKKSYKKMPYEINFDWLIAGGLLHDVGKLLEIEKKGKGYRKSYSGRCLRHPISGAIVATQKGLPEEVCNIIACHSREGDNRPQRIETVLIHQADFAVFNPMVMLEKGVLII
jgi:putative nucleotidyltransferase with HDIG domain